MEISLFFSIGCTEAGLKPNEKHAQTVFLFLLLQLSIMGNLLPTTKTNISEEVSNTVFLTSEKFWNESSYHKLLASPLPFSLWRFRVKKQLVHKRFFIDGINRRWVQRFRPGPSCHLKRGSAPKAFQTFIKNRFRNVLYGFEPGFYLVHIPKRMIHPSARDFQITIKIIWL